MPAGYKIQNIAPFELRSYPDAVKLMWWGWVVEYGILAKDRELARGLNAFGEPLRPIAPATRKHRKSAMTPSGRGDPSAPPLMPGRKLSRTRSLLAGKAFVDHAAFYWRFDPFTFDSWAKILSIHRDKGRDVFGLSPEGVEAVRKNCLARWRAWLRSGVVSPPELEGKRSIPPLRPEGAVRPIATVGRPIGPWSTPGIGRETLAGLRPGEWTGGRTEAELTAWMRQTAPANVQGRPGDAYNRILQHTWGLPRDTVGGVVQPLSPTPPKPVVTRVAMKPEPRPVPKPPGPIGVPVSSALDVQAPTRIGRAIRAVLDAIDRIHGDGNLPTIPAKQTQTTSRNGVFWRTTAGAPLKIDVSAKGDHPRLTTAHEIGHFLEWSGIPKPGIEYMPRNFRTDPRFADWAKAVDESRAIQSLRSLVGKVETAFTRPDGSEGTYRLDRQHIRYLLQDNEIWARAYAQYVATKADDPDLKADLSNHLATHYQGVYNSQWTADDFGPILTAIDALFRGLGWIR